MQRTNFEFKSRSKDLISLENKLLTLSPKFTGEDHQVDTYFNVEKGRLNCVKEISKILSFTMKEKMSLIQSNRMFCSTVSIGYFFKRIINKSSRNKSGC